MIKHITAISIHSCMSYNRPTGIKKKKGNTSFVVWKVSRTLRCLHLFPYREGENAASPVTFLPWHRTPCLVNQRRLWSSRDTRPRRDLAVTRSRVRICCNPHRQPDTARSDFPSVFCWVAVLGYLAHPGYDDWFMLALGFPSFNQR